MSFINWTTESKLCLYLRWYPLKNWINPKMCFVVSFGFYCVYLGYFCKFCRILLDWYRCWTFNILKFQESLYRNYFIEPVSTYCVSTLGYLEMFSDSIVVGEVPHYAYLVLRIFRHFLSKLYFYAITQKQMTFSCLVVLWGLVPYRKWMG